MCILPPHSRMMPMMRGWGIADLTLSACTKQPRGCAHIRNACVQRWVLGACASCVGMCMCVGMSAARASPSSPHTQSSVGTDGKGSHCQSRQRDGVLLTTDLSLLLLPCLPPAFTAPAHLVVQLLELLVIALLRIHLNLHCIHLQQLRTLLWVLTAILTLAGPGRVLFGMGVRV